MRHSSTDKNGAFEFTEVASAGLKIEVTHLGYKIYSNYIENSMRAFDLGKIKLSEDVKQIDAVVVKARLQFFTIKGDTIQFNPHAVKVLDDDMAMAIMAKMPGVEVTDLGIKVMGESVAITYVNGKAIYGENALGALRYVEASRVASIQSYDEVNADASIRSGTIKKRKVLNVLTFDMFTQSLVGDVFANYGADMQKSSGQSRQDRYAVGGGVGFFSENRRWAIDATLDNVGVDRMNAPIVTVGEHRNSSPSSNNTYNRTKSFGAAYMQKIGKPQTTNMLVEGQMVSSVYYNKTIDVLYSYRDSYTKANAINQRLYFPSSEYQAREYADTALNNSSNGVHTVKAKYDYVGKTFFALKTTVSYQQNEYADYTSASNRVDGLLVNRSAMSNSSTQDDVDVNLNWYLSESKYQLAWDGNLDYKNSDMSGWRIDTLASSTNQTYLKTTAPGDNYHFKIGIQKPFRLFQKVFTTARYTFEYKNDRSVRMAIDELSGVVDTTSTHNYTDKSISHSMGLMTSYRLENGLSFMVDLSPKLIVIGKDDLFPQEINDRKSYFAPTCNISVDYRNKAEMSVGLSYHLNTSTPSLEQLRDKLDNLNPLLLSAGNANLQSSRSHRLTLGLSRYLMEQQRYFGAHISCTFDDNYVTTRETYFARDTLLAQYNYTATKGSTLEMPENVRGKFSVSTGASYYWYSSFFKSSFRVNSSIEYSELPMFVGSQLITTSSLRPNVDLYVSSNFSSVFNLDLTSVSAYDISKNSSGIKDRRFNEKVNFKLRYNIRNRIFVNTAYEYNFVCSSNPAVDDLHNNVWNATVGVKFLKNKAGNISVSVYDILNRNKAFSTSLQDDYIMNRWQQVFSRYFTVNLSFKINVKK